MTMQQLLTDGVIAFRALEPTDVDVLMKWENDTSLWEVGATVAPYSRKQLWEYIDTYDGDIYRAGQLRFMIEECATRSPIGTADLFDFDAVNRRSSFGLLIAREYSGRGYGKRAAAILEHYCRSRLGLHQLWCVIPADNTGSRALFDKMEYRITGRLRSWLRTGESYRDAYVYQKIL